MKKNLMLFSIILVLFLSACGTSKETSDRKDAGTSTEGVENARVEEVDAAKEESESQTDTQQNSETVENADEVEVLEPSSSTDKTNEALEQPAENMLDGKKVIKYDDNNVIYTIESATFTKAVTTSNPKDDSVARKILSVNEIYLHIEGTIDNETKDSVSFAGPLGHIRFSVIYDGKHEFDGYGAVEEEDGSDFKGASSIDAFTSRKVHYYSQLPLAVSTTDKPLELIVYARKEEYKIKIR